MTTPILTVENLSVTLGGKQILDNISFTLSAGEFCGLIGSNGSGKTTLLRTLLNFETPSAGHVKIAAGQAGNQRARLGYVPQKIAIDPDMPLRARDLVELGLTGHRFGLPFPSKSRTAKVDAMLEAVDATAFGGQRVGDLSGGQQQRILIAHALIRDPALLLLDEPLANLDIKAVAEIIILVRRLAKEHGITVLISAHDMNPLLSSMDRIIYLAAGRAATGTTTEIVRTEILSALYGYHIDVIRVHGRVLVIAAGAADELPAVLDEHPAHVAAIP